MINKAQFLHGSNEVNYQNFKCKTCGNEEKFGVIICLNCAHEIAELNDKLHRRNMQIADWKAHALPLTKIQRAVIFNALINYEKEIVSCLKLVENTNYDAEELLKEQLTISGVKVKLSELIY